MNFSSLFTAQLQLHTFPFIIFPLLKLFILRLSPGFRCSPSLPEIRTISWFTLEPFTAFYSAEEEHQDYYRKHPEEFRQELIDSGRLKL